MSDQVNSNSGLELVSVDQLAVLLHKSPSSVRSDASRNPNTLPPICRLPGNKRLLWRREDVLTWFAKFVVQSAQPVAKDRSVEQPRRGRGRPRKTEQRGQF
jgi:hypothetical protein